jgi:hypothetical protein
MLTGFTGQATTPQNAGGSISTHSTSSQLESLYQLMEADSRRRNAGITQETGASKQEVLTPAHPHLKLLIKLVFELLSCELSQTSGDKYDLTWKMIVAYADTQEKLLAPDYAIFFARDSKTVVSSKEKIVSVIIFKISDQLLKEFVQGVQNSSTHEYLEGCRILEKFDSLKIPVESKILSSYQDYRDKQILNKQIANEAKDSRKLGDPTNQLVSEFNLKDNLPAVILTNSEIVPVGLTDKPSISKFAPESSRKTQKVTLGLFESSFPRSKEWVKPSETLLRDKFSRLLQTKPHYMRPDLISKPPVEKRICLGCRKNLDGITRYVDWEITHSSAGNFVTSLMTGTARTA